MKTSTHWTCTMNLKCIVALNQSRKRIVQWLFRRHGDLDMRWVYFESTKMLLGGGDYQNKAAVLENHCPWEGRGGTLRKSLFVTAPGVSAHPSICPSVCLQGGDAAKPFLKQRKEGLRRCRRGWGSAVEPWAGQWLFGAQRAHGSGAQERLPSPSQGAATGKKLSSTSV